MTHRYHVAILAGLLAAAAADAGDFLVDGAWLEAALGRPDLVVLHAEKSAGSYAAGHVPGARRVRWEELATTRDGIPNELPPYARRRELLGRLGVPPAGPVAVYGDGVGVAAGRVVLWLDTLGLADRVRLLDGQLAGWRAEGRPLSRVAARFEPSGFRGGQDPTVIARAPEVSRLMGEGARLLDARPAPQFTGADPGGGVARPGHIPGAVNAPAGSVLEPGPIPRLRPPVRLREALRLPEGEADRPVVTYCRTGAAAGLHYLALRRLGVPARYYDASFIDWSRRAELPVER